MYLEMEEERRKNLSETSSRVPSPMFTSKGEKGWR